MNYKKKNKAIVCSYDLGENALGIVRSLGRKKIYVTVIGVKGHLNIAARSKYCNNYVELPEINDKILIDLLLKIANTENTKSILYIDSCYMLEMLSNYKEVLMDNFFLTQGYSKYTDKMYQNKIATKARIPVPLSWSFDTWEDVNKNISNNIKVIAKPNYKFGKRKPFKTLIGENIQDLIKTLKNFINSPKNILFQEYIRGNESDVWVSLGYRSKRTKEVVLMTAVKHMMFPSEGGVMAIGKTKYSREIDNLSNCLLKEYNYFGIFGFEFKYSKKYNKFYYIEMSPRTEGFHNITKLVNIDLPWIAYTDIINKVDINKINFHYTSERYWINIRYLFESIYISRSIFNIKKSIFPLIMAREWQHFSLDDLKPCLYANWWFLMKMLKKIKKKIIYG